MSDIPGNIANSIVQKLVDGAIHETRYLCCYGCIAAEFENEKKNLKANLKSLQQVAERATGQGEEILSDVKQWMEKASNLIDKDTKTKKSCFFGLFPNCIWRYGRGKELQGNLKDIKELIEKFRLDNISRPGKPPGMEYFSSQDFVSLESRKVAYEQLLKELQEGNKYMIGLQGMGGSGKTRLAKRVGKEIQESKIFDKVIFVVISNPPNVRTIQDDIARDLGLSLKENELERRKELWSRIRNEKKILLILDDVWKELNFEDIGIPDRDNHEGCCILLTTRDSEVCHSMGCQRPIQLGLLSPEDAWFMFQKFSGISDDSSSALKAVAREIASECERLPIAIVTMASTLKAHLDPGYWRSILKILQSPNPIHNIQKNLERIYNCLRVSYENLECERAQGLFLLCSMFPEDHEIHIEELIRCVVGLDLFGQLDSYQTARSQVYISKVKLIDSSLLLKAEKEGCVKMHDLLREVGHWIRNYEIHETKALQEVSDVNRNKVRYLYCHNVNDFSYQLELPALEILILACNNDDGVSIPDAFFGGMKGIRVLTLKGENSWSTNIQLRPTSIEVLKNLRSLDLRNCNLGDIFVFGGLQRIETLELYYCSINELPNGILELKKLRLFRLQSCEINENPYRVIGRFSELEELYLMNNRISNGEVDRWIVSNLFDKNRISRVLQRYHIEIGGRKDVLEEYLNDSTSRALSIEHFDASASNATVKDLIQRAEILCLDKLGGDCKSIFPDLFKAIGKAMDQLIKLGLYNCSGVECLIDTSKPSSSLRNPSDFLEKIEHLNIVGCDQLKNNGLFVANLKLRALRKLSVVSCPKLTYLFTFSIAQSLVLLEFLVVESCDAMTCIIKDEIEADADHNQRTPAPNSMFPKLEVLRIRYCGQLESILSVGSNQRQTSNSTTSTNSVSHDSNFKQFYALDTTQAQSLLFNNVRRMTLKGCPELKWVFTLSNATTMQLESLKINGCDGLKYIIIVVGDDDANYTSILPNFRQLEVFNCKQLEGIATQASHDSNLKQFYALDTTQAQSLLFNNVQYMTLEGCPELKWVFTLSNATTMQLEYLEIRRCDGLKHIIIVAGDDDANYTSILPNFRQLDVRDCKQLEQIATQVSQDSNLQQFHALDTTRTQSLLFNNVRHITLEECPQLKWPVFTLFNATTMQLEYLWIGGCDGLKHIIIVAGDDDANYTSILPNFKQLRVIDCKQLEQIATQVSQDSNLQQFHALNTTQAQSLLFNNVRWMTLMGCPELKWPVFTLSNVTTMQLEYLRIQRCDGLEHIITDGGDNNDSINSTYTLQKLKSVYIFDCKQLKCVFGHHENNSSYQNHTSDLEIHIHLSALEQVTLETLPHMISICSKKYHATCPSLKELDYKDCPQFVKASVIDFIEHSDAAHMKCNQEDSKELLEKYKKELQTEEENFSKNVSPYVTESKETEQESVQDSKFEKHIAEASSSLPESNIIGETMKQSVQKIPTSEKEKMPTSSLVDSEPRDSQTTKGSIQEDLASTKVEIGTSPSPSSLAETSSLTITDALKQSVQEAAIPEKSKIATSLTNYGPKILSPGSSVIPIEDALSEKLMEKAEVDFHGLFKIDPRRASLLDGAFAKYPHLWDWQQSVRPKFCKWGYESLSDMLVFLKEKTPKALMDGSSKEEFEKLYAELESFRFDKNWLASIHQRVMGLQVDNEKLKHLVELEAQMNNVKAGIARIKDDLISKYEAVFDF